MSNNGQSRGGQGGGKGDDQQTGAALGTQVIRYSGIHGIGLVVSNLLTFVATIVIANFSEPAEFGQLGLLLFFAGLMTLLFTLAVKQGTLKRTFGGDDDDDDDDDDEDDDDDLAHSPKRSFFTGLATITIVSTIGTALAVIFSGPLADRLLGGGADPGLLVWAAIAGGTGALYRVTSIALWIERRPYAYIAVETSKPLLTLAAVVPLLIAGMGIEGAILGQAIGTALATVFSLVLLRGSWEPCFDWREAIAIYRKGAIRVPLVLSMWVVGFADIFILSRYVSNADLGTYHLASRAALLVAILPGGYRKALRPLQKTPMFRAVEQQYGVGNARGIQFGYFMMMLAGTMLATAVLAHALVRVAPSSYSDSAPLIPLIAGGLVAPTVYRMINKSVKYADKRVPFIIGAVSAALLFVGLSMLLVPGLGVIGTPLAMIVAFAPAAAYIFIRSQRGRSPIVLPWRPMLLAIGLAFAVGFAHGLVGVHSIVGQIALGLAAMVLWVALLVLTRAVPRAHRGALVGMVRGLRRRHGFDTEAALEALGPRERRALKRAILRGMPADEAASVLGNEPINEPPGSGAAVLVALLRRAAAGGGAPGLPRGYANVHDAALDEAIGNFLFAQGAVAERDQLGKRLINNGEADAFDLHTLELVFGALTKIPKGEWSAD